MTDTQEAAVTQDHGNINATTENLTINSIIAHRVRSPIEVGTPRPPILATRAQTMSDDLAQLVKMRIVQSLNKRAKTLALKFERTGPGTFFAYGVPALCTPSELEFVKQSQEIAGLLGDKHTRAVPEGLLITCQATIGKNKALILIKADEQDGIAGVEDESQNTVLELIKSLFLTKGSKLHKVFVMVQRGQGAGPADFQAVLYDGNLEKDDDLRPAQYFFREFLGTEVAREGRRDTYQFYEAATTAINQLGVSSEDRLELGRALDAYMTGPVATFTIAEYVTAAVPVPIQDAFEANLRELGAPEGAIVKDTRDIRTRIKYTTIETDNGVRISVPSYLEDEAIVLVTGDERVTLTIKGTHVAVRK